MIKLMRMYLHQTTLLSQLIVYIFFEILMVNVEIYF